MATPSGLRNDPVRLETLRRHAVEIIGHVDALLALSPTERADAVTTEANVVHLLAHMHLRTGASRHRQRSALVTHQTVRVTHSTGGEMVINAEDFDPAVHTRVAD